MPRIGSRVHVRYEDALKNKILWAGTVTKEVPEGWLVDLGGIAIKVKTEDIIEDEANEERRTTDGQAGS